MYLPNPTPKCFSLVIVLSHSRFVVLLGTERVLESAPCGYIYVYTYLFGHMSYDVALHYK